MTIEYISFDEVINKKDTNSISDPSLNKLLNLMYDDISLHESNKGKQVTDLSIKIESKFITGLVEFDVLQSMLSGVQDLVDSVFNDFFGNKSVKGRISEKIMERSKLLVTSIQPGSFIINFDFVENKYMDVSNQLLFDEKIDVSSSKEIVDELFRDLYQVDYFQEKIVNLTSKYGARTINSAKKLFKENDKKGINFVFNNENLKTSLKFDTHKVIEISSVLDKIQVQKNEKKINIVGKLTAFDMQRKTFILDNEVEHIKFHIVDSNLKDVKLVSNNKYKVSGFIIEEIDLKSLEVISSKYIVENIDINIQELF